MHTKSIVLFLGIIFCSLIHAQQKDQVLLTIDNTPVYTSEFKRVYLKNIDLVQDDTQKNVDQYLDLFIKYKLKLAAAKELGLDKKEKHIKELKGYRKQLSAAYLTDTKASEKLVKEAYDHMQERINASHILVMVKEGASPQDTLKAFQKITEARSKVVEGEDFATIAKAYSEDPSAQKNGGDLGWFSAFRMVYTFEKAAYSTKVGEVSIPFRTRFGYHIVRVNDREQTLGEVEVAHIMVAIDNDRTEAQAKEKITEINQQLQQKASFESLAKQYSDDRNTGVNGGKINRFAQGALNSVLFEKTAFSLSNPGELSKPIKTKYGWHIIKLIKKFPPKKFEELETELTKKIKRDERSKMITTSFINSLKEKYGVVKNEEAVRYFKENSTDSTFVNGWVFPKNDKNQKKKILSLGEKKYTYADFVDFFNSQIKKKLVSVDNMIFIENMYADFEAKKILKYYEEHLEDDNEEFANIITEYREGLLLFDLMEAKVWNVSKIDSVGLSNFYESRKNQYAKPEAFKVIKASSSNVELMDTVKKLMKSGKSKEEINTKVNSSKQNRVLLSEEELIKGQDDVISKFSGKLGEIISFEEDNYITLIKLLEIVPSKIKTFEQAKGNVINDYQESLEKEWIEKLREKYSVEINEKILKKVKKQLTI